MKVILIHGMFCGTKCWDLLDGLLREQGIEADRTSLHPGGVAKLGRDFDAVTTSVRAQIHRLDDQHFVLVGHSLGALVVENLLPAFPHASAVLVNPSPKWGSFGPVYPLWIAARRGLFWRDIVSLNRGECHGLLFQGMSGQELEAALAIVEAESGELMRQAFWFFDLIGAATRIPGTTTREVSVLAGALDPMATTAYCRQLVSRYGCGSNLEVVEKAGHVLILQDPGAHLLAKRITAVVDAQQRAAADAAMPRA